MEREEFKQLYYSTPISRFWSHIEAALRAKGDEQWNAAMDEAIIRTYGRFPKQPFIEDQLIKELEELKR